MKTNPELITKATEVVLMVIATLITTYVIPWLRTKIESDKREKIKIFCEQAVRAAEQIYTPEEWKLKKEYVRTLIKEQVGKLGLGFNEAEIDAIIEGIVNFVKHNKTNGG